MKHAYLPVFVALLLTAGLASSSNATTAKNRNIRRGVVAATVLTLGVSGLHRNFHPSAGERTESKPAISDVRKTALERQYDAKKSQARFALHEVYASRLQDLLERLKKKKILTQEDLLAVEALTLEIAEKLAAGLVLEATDIEAIGTLGRITFAHANRIWKPIKTETKNLEAAFDVGFTITPSRNESYGAADIVFDLADSPSPLSDAASTALEQMIAGQAELLKRAPWDDAAYLGYDSLLEQIQTRISDSVEGESYQAAAPIALLKAFGLSEKTQSGEVTSYHDLYEHIDQLRARAASRSLVGAPMSEAVANWHSLSSFGDSSHQELLSNAFLKGSESFTATYGSAREIQGAWIDSDGRRVQWRDQMGELLIPREDGSASTPDALISEGVQRYLLEHQRLEGAARLESIRAQDE